MRFAALGLRGEESAWFSIHHIGARAALGLLPAEEIDQARRFDTQRTLAEYMLETGCDLEALRGVLDSGHTRATSNIIRTLPSTELGGFNTFAPVAIALIAVSVRRMNRKIDHHPVPIGELA